MRSIREEFEEQEKQNRQQMFDKITACINDIRHHVINGEDRAVIVAELEELEEALS
jgi:hypothetical protein